MGPLRRAAPGAPERSPRVATHLGVVSAFFGILATLIALGGADRGLSCQHDQVGRPGTRLGDGDTYSTEGSTSSTATGSVPPLSSVSRITVGTGSTTSRWRARAAWYHYQPNALICAEMITCLQIDQPRSRLRPRGGHHNLSARRKALLHGGKAGHRRPLALMSSTSRLPISASSSVHGRSTISWLKVSLATTRAQAIVASAPSPDAWIRQLELSVLVGRAVRPCG